MAGIIALILWPLTIFAFIINNLLQRSKKLEDIIVEKDNQLSQRDTYIANISSLIQESHQIIEEAEVSKAFKSDDEIGGFFTNLKNIQKAIDSYNVSGNGR